MMPVLEIIACSVADAIEAERGGASRLEIIRDFARGGLTPPFELVRDILAAVTVPVRVMLRESEGYTVAGEDEIEKLCVAARDLPALQIDGVVLGFLRDGEIDVDLTRRVLACAPNVKATFHHAFEETRNPFASIEKLKQLPQIDRLLTSGGSGDWPQRSVRLARYERAAQPQIKILAGGGLNKEAIRAVCEATGIREFHVGRAARLPASVDGAVNALQIRELISAMRCRKRNYTNR